MPSLTVRAGTTVYNVSAKGFPEVDFAFSVDDFEDRRQVFLYGGENDDHLVSLRFSDEGLVEIWVDDSLGIPVRLGDRQYYSETWEHKDA